MEAEEGPAHLSISPTFSSYSSGSSSLAEIASRVVREIGVKPFADADNNYGWKSQGSVYRFRDNSSNGDGEAREGVRSENADADDDEFEFAVLCREPDASTSSAHEIFSNGQIKPVYPLFNKDLLQQRDNAASRVDAGLENSKMKPAVRRSPLRKLMNEEERKPASIDLGTVPTGTYCVWSPGSENKTSPGRSKKRISTGSSNRWKLKDLLHNYSRSKTERDQDEIVRRKTNIKKDDQSGNVSSKVKEDSRIRRKRHILY